MTHASPAQRLYTLLKEAFPDHTDEQIGAEVRVSKASISKWKTGGGNLRHNTIKKAAEKLGMTPGELTDRLEIEGGPVEYDTETPPP